MRLESVYVRHYRLHRECRVEFDPARTLIGGPNEAGKSTLVEAAHRALFLRAKTGGEVQRSMISTHHGGQPEVEVVFAARGGRWRILKRFSGSSGTATLTQLGGGTWSGAEAEEKLRDLLGVEAIGANASKLREQWAHLWIWQGCAGEDPTAHANTHHRDLLTRLQQEGGAAAVQSPADQRVAHEIAQRHEAIFRDDGKARAGSALAAAEAEEEAARTALEAAQVALTRLETAAHDFTTAEEAMRAAAAALEQLQPQQRTVAEKLSQVTRLRSEEAAQLPQAQAAAEKRQSAIATDLQIRQLRAEGEAQARTLAPLQEQAARLEAAVRDRVREEEDAERQWQEKTAAVRTARSRLDLATAHLQLGERTASCRALQQRCEQLATLQKELTAGQTSLATTPLVTNAKLAVWQKLERDLGEATAARDAMATGLEVLAADTAVRIGERALQSGEAEILTDETVLAIGERVRLRIRPGGGSSLAAARRRVNELDGQLRRALDEAALPSLAAAAEASARRQQLEGEIRTLQARLEALGAGTVEQQLAVAEQERAALAGQVEHRRQSFPDFPAPPEAEASRALVEESAQILREAEQAEAKADGARQAASRHVRESRELWEAQQAAGRQRQQDLASLQAQLRLLLDTYGDDEARTRRLGELAREAEATASALDTTRRTLAALQPELLERDRVRLERAIEQHTRTHRDAQVAAATARGELQRDGSTDPHAEVALAAERWHRAVAQKEREQQRAAAIAQLHALFGAEQKALAEQFTRPLAARISRYLECLFGPGARAEVTLEDGTFGGLRLVRPGPRADAEAFDRLSGGAREQLGAAVRLALAEVLAEAHDGCLPVVFDDAFAYSDPVRVQVLQRMLDVAADRGLQIIVLSCNPADYAALGARQVLLPAGEMPV